MANLPNYFSIPAVVAQRKGEVPDADFDGGMNNAGCLQGVGIATDEPNLTGDIQQWTLLDQNGAARTPQDSSYIGGNGLGSGTVTVEPIDVAATTNADGTVTSAGKATLASLAAGWTAV